MNRYLKRPKKLPLLERLNLTVRRSPFFPPAGKHKITWSDNKTAENQRHPDPISANIRRFL